MQEIQIVADSGVFKYIIVGIGSLIGVINFLAGIILRGIMKSINELKIARQEDHDALNTLIAEHKILHPTITREKCNGTKQG